MTPALPSSVSYDDLNGEEALEILHTRFYDLIHTLPELQKRFALTRLVMKLEITLDIWGATPAQKVYRDQFEVRGGLPAGSEDTVYVGDDDKIMDYSEAHHQKSAVIDSRENPPDQVREQHGLPVPRMVRGQAGFMETQMQNSGEESEYPKPPQPKTHAELPRPIPADQIPANQPNPNERAIGKRTYASWVEQDYGSLQGGERSGNESPVVGGAKVSGPKTDVTVLGLPIADGSELAPPQADFRVADFRNVKSDKANEIVSDAIKRGTEVDRSIARRGFNASAPKPKGRK